MSASAADRRPGFTGLAYRRWGDRTGPAIVLLHSLGESSTRATPARAVPEKPDADLRCDWRVVPAIYAQRNEPDPRWWDALARISIPTLVIAGGATSHVDQQQLAELADQLTDGRLVTIDAGHDVHTKEPEAFVDTIAAFLGL